MEDEDIVGPGSKESTLARGGGYDGCHKLSNLWKRAPLNELADPPPRPRGLEGRNAFKLDLALARRSKPLTRRRETVWFLSSRGN